MDPESSSTTSHHQTSYEAEQNLSPSSGTSGGSVFSVTSVDSTQSLKVYNDNSHGSSGNYNTPPTSSENRRKRRCESVKQFGKKQLKPTSFNDSGVSSDGKIHPGEKNTRGGFLPDTTDHTPQQSQEATKIDVSKESDGKEKPKLMERKEKFRYPVFFMRNDDSSKLYQFGVVHYSGGGQWRILKLNGKVISYESIADVLYMLVLPKGLNIRFRKSGEHERFTIAAVLAESVFCMTKKTKLPIRVIEYGSTSKTTTHVPICDNIGVWQEHMKILFQLHQDCYVRIFRDDGGGLRGWINLNLMTQLGQRGSFNRFTQGDDEDDEKTTRE